MFPDVEFLGMDLYLWMIVAGVIAAMVVFRLCHARAGLSVRVFNFSLLISVAAIILGYLSAVLFQSWYAFLETGVYEWGVGATFYGGLIGAVAVFLALYFGVGHFLFRDRRHIAEFNRMLSLIVPCIVIAHAFGRIGCLFDGCCYGAVTDAWFGIPMRVGGVWERRVPIQLFESLFLFALFGVLIFLVLKFRCEYTASLYLVIYGVWRFFIEFARADDRGASGVGALTPSQLTAILLVAAGIALFFIYRYALKGYFARVEAAENGQKTAENEAENGQKTAQNEQKTDENGDETA